MIPDGYDEYVHLLKQSVNAMLQERQAIRMQTRTGLPSPLWEEVVNVYRYLMNLSAEDLYNIRFHTELINGVALLRYWHPYPQISPEQEAVQIGYLGAIASVPEEYWLTEPPTPFAPRTLGVDYRGRIVNPNVVRYQTCVSNLYLSGVLDAVASAGEKQIIVEVGSGFGGLAHGIAGILGTKATYVLIDLPEVLLMSGSYLAAHNSDKKIYVYNRETFNQTFLSSGLYSYDFVLLPNYLIGELGALKEIAVMINMQSFQEMTEAQIREYLGFFRDRIRFCVYSDNLDRHPHNTTGKFMLSPLLQEYFDLQPDPSFYDTIYHGQDLLGYNSYKRYLGFKKGSGLPVNFDLERLLVRDSMSLAKHRLEYLQAEMNALVSSISWRITAPLRTLVRLLRRWELDR